MKYCFKCGKEINDEAVICVHCGSSVGNTSIVPDAPNAGMAVLGFFYPVVGLILYLVWHETKPLKARSAGKGALTSAIIGASFVVVYFLIIILAAVVGVY